jgi:hypothetical protein
MPQITENQGLPANCLKLLTMVALRICWRPSMTGPERICHALIKHRSMLLGAILICLVWVTLFFFLKNGHDSAERAAIQNSTNLTGAFEEHLSRSISELDRSLKIIRALHARDRGRFDLVDWLRSNRILTDEVLQITIVDRD